MEWGSQGARSWLWHGNPCTLTIAYLTFELPAANIDFVPVGFRSGISEIPEILLSCSVWHLLFVRFWCKLCVGYAEGCCWRNLGVVGGRQNRGDAEWAMWLSG